MASQHQNLYPMLASPGPPHLIAQGSWPRHISKRWVRRVVPISQRLRLSFHSSSRSGDERAGITGEDTCGNLSQRILTTTLCQCMKVKRESEVAQSCPTPHDPVDSADQAPPSMGLSRQEYWSGVPLPSPFAHSRCAQLGINSGFPQGYSSQGQL